MLWVTSADLAVSHCLFLSLGTGAWNDVSMEDLQSCIMNQDDSIFFQELPLRSGGGNSHVEVPILSVQRDVKIVDMLTLSFFSFHCLSFFIWGDVATGTKRLVWVQPFLSNVCRSSCWDVCCPELQRDENAPTCHYGCHPSPESTSHQTLEVFIRECQRNAMQ